MKITIFGSGYVGLVTGASLANSGHHVTCVDINQEKVDQLTRGESPIWEPGLSELLKSNLEQGRLHFTINAADALDGSQAAFIAVGTPSAEDGSADLKFVTAVARTIGQVATAPLLVIDKSTVPVGTATLVQKTIDHELSKRNSNFNVSVCSNPEFLKEGSAIADFKHGERIVIGVSNEEDEAVMREIYAPFNRNHDKIIVMDIRSAELTKYAANAMLAAKISFMNEVSRIAEATGADIDSVRIGIGSDPRIGSSFLYAGAGYGGSCFPKDVKALAHTAKSFECESLMLDAIESVNSSQKQLLFAKLQALIPELHGKKIAVWGLAFKPKTDDVREAPALTVIRSLLGAGCQVAAYDPVATETFKHALGEDIVTQVNFTETALDAADSADALVICTEWEEFRVFNAEGLSQQMKGRVIVDVRNLYPIDTPVEHGFTYASIGRQTAVAE